MPDDPVVSAPTYTVAVRALCEFTARQGDLDLRFTPSPTAQEGMAGHTLVASRRGADYQTELPLSGHFEGAGQTLHVRGRADGFDASRLRLEEIKTHRGPLDTQPANHRHLHWAQARVYGHLLCAQQGLTQLDIALVYLDVGSEQETVLLETWSAEALHSHFAGQCQRFLSWAAQEAAHRQVRDQALTHLQRPAPAGRGRLQGRHPSPLPARPGAHWHRQDHRHPVPPAQGLPLAGHRQGLLPVGQDLGAATRARRAAAASSWFRCAPLARAGTGGPRQGLRTPGQGLPW